MIFHKNSRYISIIFEVKITQNSWWRCLIKIFSFKQVSKLFHDVLVETGILLLVFFDRYVFNILFHLSWHYFYNTFPTPPPDVNLVWPLVFPEGRR